MLQNVIAGLQGIIDHAMVGHYVGYTANAAIGVSWQIFLVVIVFIASLYSGMGVLVARFTGAGEPDKVNRVVHQAFLTSIVLSVVLAVAGYAARAVPARRRPGRARGEGGRAAVPADDVRRQRRPAGVLHDRRRVARGRRCAHAAAPRASRPRCSTRSFNVVLIPGLGSALGPFGAALGTVIANLIVATVGNAWMLSGRLVGPGAAAAVARARLGHHPLDLQVRAADRPAGHRDERGRRAAAALHRIARTQRRGAGGLRRRLHRTVLADHVDVGGPDGRDGHGGRPEPRSRQARAQHRGRLGGRPHRPRRRRGGRARLRR